MLELLNEFYHNKKILVTGHTGFKGSWLSLWLTRLGADVIGYSLDPPTEPNFFNLCHFETKMTSIKGDIRDFLQLRSVIEKYQPQIVFHLAAQPLVRRSYQDPLETYSTNIMGTVNLFEAVRQVGATRAVINVTSDKCYENKEWIWGYRENEPMGGFDPYSSSKGCSELITNAYRRSFFNRDQFSAYHTALASVRAGNVIGGGDWAGDRIIPDCIRAMSQNNPIIIRSPKAIRPWQHVLEPVYGYLLLAAKLYQEGPAYAEGWNFGPNEEDAKPVEWIAAKMTVLWGKNAVWKADEGPHPHEANYLKLDCSKAKSKLGWMPCWNISRTLEKTVEWYQAYFAGQDMEKMSLDQLRSYEESLKEREA